MSLLDRLTAFADENGYTTVGGLNVALLMTRRARDEGLPLDPERQLSEKSRTQVRGLNGNSGNAILADYGVPYRFGTESGRTNRGAAEQMRGYVAFLNDIAATPGFSLPEVERFWVDRIVARFENKPFKLKREAGVSIQGIIRDLMQQAHQRQQSSGGAMISGTVMQHLVGAKLEAALYGRAEVMHHGANTSDQKGRGGDFDLGDTAIHVTTSPGELLIEKCRGNIDAGLRPLIVTTATGVAVASGLAEQRGLSSKIDIHAVEQFIALNVLELGVFDAAQITASLRDIIDRYNRIVDAYETNPSLRIEWA